MTESPCGLLAVCGFFCFYLWMINMYYLCLQEYCIRHVDGSFVKSKAQRQRVIQCIEQPLKKEYLRSASILQIF
ncbi:hypothetical protein HanRHA438_Chr00c30g0855011 [Helianthus annuus]|nr:hypothetical protein HanRHA438_Chr00c30g0855011 [Helianthus annuus]